MPWRVCFTLPLPLLCSPSSPPRCSRCVLKRSPIRACTQPADAPPSTSLASSKPAPLVNKRDTPAIFNGPEAVLAVLLAAAALLADFVRNMTRLSSVGTEQALDLDAAESTVANLKQSLLLNKQLLTETEGRLLAVTEQRKDVQYSLAGAEGMRKKMSIANQYVQNAQEELHRLQRALSRVQQERTDIAQDQEQIEAERQRVEEQIAKKRLLLDRLCEKIEKAKTTEMELKKRLEYQKALLTKQTQRAADMRKRSAADAGAQGQVRRGGDSARSEMSLQEIKRNLSAERLALSADIRKAKVATDAATEENADKLQLLKREMKAKRDSVRARLKKAQTTVDMEAVESQRRDKAIDQVLDSIENSDGGEVLVDRVKEPERKSSAKKRGRKAKQEVTDNDVSALGDSGVTPVKQKTRTKKSVKSDTVVEETLSATTQDDANAVDDKSGTVKGASQVDVDNAETAASTGTEAKGEVKKRSRTRTRASSDDGATANSTDKTKTTAKTKTKKTTRKKRDATDEDRPMSFKEAAEVRQVVMDMLNTEMDAQGLPLVGHTATEGELRQAAPHLSGGAEVEREKDAKDGAMADGKGSSAIHSTGAEGEGAAGAEIVKNANVNESAKAPRPKGKRRSGPSSKSDV